MPNYNLTGQKIKDTYSQLTQVSASTLVDGLGVAAPITTASITNFPTEVSRSAAAAGFGQGSGGGVSEATFTAYTASNDLKVSSLTSATSSYALKTAISGASAPGLVAGTALFSSMASAAHLTTLPATASGNYSIALGDDARALNQQSIAIGRIPRAYASHSIAIGWNASAGYGATALFDGDMAIAIGYGAEAKGSTSIAIGGTAQGGRDGGIAIGYSSGIATNVDGIVSIGNNSAATDGYAVALGNGSSAGYQATALGHSSVASAAYSTALGSNVTANVTNYTTTNYLQLIQVSSSMGQYGYANDSIAAGAGVPLGGVYHTSGSLKIRMV